MSSGWHLKLCQYFWYFRIWLSYRLIHLSWSLDSNHQWLKYQPLIQLLTNDHRNLGKFTGSSKFRGKVSKKCPIHNRLPSKQIQLSIAFTTFSEGHHSRPEATWKRNCRSYGVDCIKKKLRLSRQNALKHSRICSTTSSDQQPPSYLDKRRTRSQQRPRSTLPDTPAN